MALGHLLKYIKYYLAHDEERERIALNGFRRVRNDYKISELLWKAGDVIKKGMEQRVSNRHKICTITNGLYFCGLSLIGISGGITTINVS